MPPNASMPETGVELSPLTPPKSQISPHGGTESGTVDDTQDVRLTRLIEAWPTLPEQTKTKIKGLIERHAAEKKADVERQN